MHYGFPQTLLVVTMQNSLDPFFNPQGIAVIGASQNPTKLGFTLAQNLKRSGYTGTIQFVNPHGGQLLGQSVQTQIAGLEDPVDLAVVLIPAQFVARALAECGERGIRAAIIASGGFREIGEEGARLEAECVEVAQQYGMRLIGPNCIGLIDTHLPVDSTFLPPPGPTPGDVAFISHSGAICAAVVDWARGQGFGLSRLVSLGNQADVRESEVLEPVAADPHTSVITLYLEGVSDGRRFVDAAQRVTRQKPIVALKVGRFESGQQAVASHTGALAGSESAYAAAFESAGVIRAETSEELFDWARALAWCPPSKGKGVAVLTNAGGPGVTASDAIEAAGLHLAPLSYISQRDLQDLLPEAASINNPVDMLASATPEQYARCLQILLDDPQVDSCLVILPPPPMHSAGSVARALIPLINVTEKPVVIALMGERMIQEAVEYFRAARVPEYRFPERAASALAILAQRADYLSMPPFQEPDPKPVNQKAAEQLLKGQKSAFLEPRLANALLQAYGIPTPELRFAKTSGEAQQAAAEIGFPVALKIVSEDLIHKSDVGGVAINLNTVEKVGSACEIMLNEIQRRQPGVAADGFLVQEMVGVGQELILGSVQDPQFGALAMFGSGGVEVEGLDDVEFALAPLSSQAAKQLAESTWAGRKLSGYRNIEPVNTEAVIDALVRLSQLAADFPELTEIEINPLVAGSESVTAIDARIRLERTGTD